jgi:hypothetical protein
MAQTSHKARIAVAAGVVDPDARFLNSVIVIRPMLNGHLTLHDSETLALCDIDNLVFKIDSGLEMQEEIPLGAPEVVVAPVITGPGSYGQVHTCSTGEWTNSPDEYAYQWMKAPAIPYAGETNPTYAPPKSERGNQIYCTVTASNALGWGAADSSNMITVGNVTTKAVPKPKAADTPAPDPTAGTANTTGTAMTMLNIPLDKGLTCSALGANGEFLVVYSRSA